MPATGQTLGDVGINPPVAGMLLYSGVDAMSADIEIPASGLVDAHLAAELAGVKVGTIRQWKNRGHLLVARDVDGQEFKDAQGRQLFDYMDVINAEYRLRAHARREAVPYLRQRPSTP